MPARTLSTQTHSHNERERKGERQRESRCRRQQLSLQIQLPTGWVWAVCLGRHSAALFVCQHNESSRRHSKHPAEPFTRKYNKIQKKKMCMKRKKICLPLLHANCANPFKGKAVAALRAFHTNQCFYLSHSTVMSASLCASHTRARLNTQTADEATCLENNLKAQKVSKAARIGTS